jgi:hypothetical protein
VFISAQTEGTSGDITGRILVGVEISENTASGGYTITTCQGRTEQVGGPAPSLAPVDRHPGS